VVSQDTVAEIDLNALSHNLGVVRNKTGKKNILAVVKANAYGHGAVEISRRLLLEGVSHLGTAFTGEAVRLREEGITAPILVFFDREHVEECLQYGLTPLIFDYGSAKQFSAAAGKLGCRISIHIKVDTGMGRLGMPLNEARKEIPRIAALENIDIEGLMSHFSDADLRDKAFARLQLKAFLELRKELKQKNITVKYSHIANSAAVLGMAPGHLNMVRPGIMLYGYGADELKPVLSLKTRVLMIKKVPSGTFIGYGRTFITKRRSIVATIPVGYADGYSRRLSNQGEVLIRGKRAPVLGRVCMDTFMVDVTDIPGADLNSEVVLIGSQGKEKITAADIAEKTGTIPYEVLTSIGQRVRRVYK